MESNTEAEIKEETKAKTPKSPKQSNKITLIL